VVKTKTFIDAKFVEESFKGDVVLSWRRKAGGNSKRAGKRAWQ
jgi:hypothetical protein